MTIPDSSAPSQRIAFLERELQLARQEIADLRAAAGMSPEAVAGVVDALEQYQATVSIMSSADTDAAGLTEDWRQAAAALAKMYGTNG